MAKHKSPPAETLEGREKQLISMAYDYAEQQMREGKASSQIIAHFLKKGSIRERAEIERLEEENKLLRARTEQIESQKNVEEMYAKAIQAMTVYSGEQVVADEYDG